MPRPSRPRELEQVAVPDEVRLDIGRGVLEAVAHPGLRPEVDDVVEVIVFGESRERLRVRKVQRLEAEAVAELSARLSSRARFSDGS